MRRIASVTALVLALAAAPAAAHPGHGPLNVGVFDTFFTPGNFEISTGDTIIWSWDGATGNHTVSSDTFESDPGVAPGAVSHPLGHTFSHTFNQTGTFRYLCRVHGFRGTIVVTDALGPPPTADSVAPRVSKVQVTGKRLRFTLSEAATVTIDLVRARVVRSADIDGVAGVNRTTLRTAGLRRGSYRVSIAAIDAAGNTSRRARATLRIRPPAAVKSDPPRTCGRVHVHGTFIVRVHQLPCRTGIRWTRAYLGHRAVPRGYHCDPYTGPIAGIPWVCRNNRVSYRQFWVVKPAG